MQGAERALTNACIGPVPADETLIIADPNDSLAALSTTETNGSLNGVLAAASPWISTTSMSSNPFDLRCFFKRANWISGTISGTSLKSILTLAFDGRTVFA